jgi:phosphopantothenoylcysteine decarboxylase/phosphopantothenate--cysteine ligase
MLAGRRVLVGVCGSIAAYKMAQVVRDLVSAGAAVRVVMTPAATRFVGPETFAALSGEPVHSDLHADAHRVIHVELGRWAEAFVIGAATASTLARLASGSADELVSAAYLMCRAPVVVAPAMHTEMWEHSSVQRNVARVLADGARLVEPEVGALASGDFGAGRLADPSRIVEAIRRALSPKDLSGVRVLITSGPTQEPLDPVRFISNRSSGRMGQALAAEATRRGGSVTVITGPASVALPEGAEVVRVTTAQEMLDACLSAPPWDVAVLVAAVADWRPSDPAAGKIKKSDQRRSVEMEPTTDIAAELGRRKQGRLLVAFAAETSDLIGEAKRKLLTKNADLVVANVVGQPGTGFDSETNDASIVTPEGAEELPRLRKAELATLVFDRVASMLRAPTP